MSVTSNTPQASPSSAARDIVLAPNGTADTSLVTSGTWYISSMVLDNSANAAASFFKLFDNSSVTVGTTVPDFVFKLAASEILRVNFQSNKPKFTSTISACCTTAGGTAGSTSPSSAVAATLTVHQ